ncbi:hypothetical protein ALC56_13105 [Trachymyrmex septentrionalis]|uniref:Uncharacterized protein n=1 Tax=Trachymyrmex septentrionalis TaxID=34720 RepID=A0A195EWL6_9HYME|nr:hypothetical protein ALC56_13105 [Trachymyrmex septentrionalis]
MHGVYMWQVSGEIGNLLPDCRKRFDLANADDHQSVRHSWLCTYSGWAWYQSTIPSPSSPPRRSERALPPGTWALGTADWHTRSQPNRTPKPSGRVNVPVHRGSILRNDDDDDRSS